MTLTEARARAVQYSRIQQCVVHINVTVKFDVLCNGYFVDSTAYTVSDWSDSATVETYINGDLA